MAPALGTELKAADDPVEGLVLETVEGIGMALEGAFGEGLAADQSLIEGGGEVRFCAENLALMVKAQVEAAADELERSLRVGCVA
jgi:hypothetical protein